MLTVETIGRIWREHFLKGKTIKEIARDLKVSRNTVRRVLRSGETSFEYEREVQPRPKLGRWTEELDELLAGNAAKPAREQLTLIRLFEELRGRGYDGGYDAVRRYARRWAKERGQATAAAYVPLSFAPGEAFQFDWSHEVVLLSGVTVIVKVAHVRLCHSRMLFVRAYPRETQEMVFDAHDPRARCSTPASKRKRAHSPAGSSAPPTVRYASSMKARPGSPALALTTGLAAGATARVLKSLRRYQEGPRVERGPLLFSTGNVARHSHRSHPHSALLLMKTKTANDDLERTRATLAEEIRRAMDRHKISPQVAHKLTGSPREDFSRLRNGRLERFTLDRMIKISRHTGRRHSGKDTPNNNCYDFEGCRGLIV